jgi:hypothetical protein
MDQHNVQSDILQATTRYNNEHNQKFAENLVSKNIALKQQTMKILECTEHFDENTTFFKFTKVCYKPNSQIPIIEESAKLKIAEILVNKYGKKIVIEDIEPLIQEVKKEYGLLFSYTILSSGKHDIDSLNNSEEFCIIMGEILQQILLDEIDNGTPRENDTEKLNLQ